MDRIKGVEAESARAPGFCAGDFTRPHKASDAFGLIGNTMPLSVLTIIMHAIFRAIGIKTATNP